jgi:hypothetical protein
MEEALDMVTLSAPAPNACVVHTDRKTRQRVAIFLDGDQEDRAAVLYYLRGEKTVVRRVTRTGERSVDLNLGGRLPVSIVAARLLVTAAVRSTQLQLNFAATILTRVMEAGGFPERVHINSEPAGTWVEVEKGRRPTPGRATKVEDGTVFELIRARRLVGSGTITELTAQVIKGKGTHPDTPLPVSALWKEPTDPEHTIKSIDHVYVTVLRQMRQGHIAANAEAAPSGRSRREMRSDHERDVDETRQAVESGAAEGVESAFALAEELAGVPGRFTGTLRAVVSLHVDTGPVSAEDIDANEKQVRAGLMSVETAMARNGIDNPEAEVQRIRKSPAWVAEHRAKLLSNMQLAVLMFPDGDRVQLAVVAGFEPDEAEALFRDLATAEAQAAAERRRLTDRIRGAAA